MERQIRDIRCYDALLRVIQPSSDLLSVVAAKVYSKFVETIALWCQGVATC